MKKPSVPQKSHHPGQNKAGRPHQPPQQSPPATTPETTLSRPSSTAWSTIFEQAASLGDGDAPAPASSTKPFINNPCAASRSFDAEGFLLHRHQRHCALPGFPEEAMAAAFQRSRRSPVPVRESFPDGKGGLDAAQAIAAAQRGSQPGSPERCWRPIFSLMRTTRSGARDVSVKGGS